MIWALALIASSVRLVVVLLVVGSLVSMRVLVVIGAAVAGAPIVV